jgi:MoxR-like ATPase
MYFEGFLPFVQELGYMEKNKKVLVNVDDVFCPLISDKPIEAFERDAVFSDMISKRVFRVLHVEPIGVKVFLENDSLSYYIKKKFSGQSIRADVTVVEYGDIAKQMIVENGVVRIPKNGGFLIQENILTDLFVISAANGVPVNTQSLIESLSIQLGERVSLYGAFEETNVKEAATQADFDEITQGFLQDKTLGTKVDTIDFIYEWMNAYFQLPEGQDMMGVPMSGGTAREVVPLLIGPTGVFKSATVKTLCDKYNFRYVDFRVAFTSKLDYSGVYNIVGDYSHACPMEELVVCSDGFRAYCKKALVLIEKTLKSGEIVVKRDSPGNTVLEEKVPLQKSQMDTLTQLMADYNNYVRTPVLFFDEITRNKNKGVEGVLTSLLNQKRFNNMTMNNCKFVAATNFNFNEPIINDIYDVSDDIDTAYANRFLRLAVYPAAVQPRWVEWANKNKKDKTIPNMIPVLMDYLRANNTEIYNEGYILNVYKKAQIDPILEASATPFPNYRTWELVSNYLYSIDSTKKFNMRIMDGLIGSEANAKLIKFLIKKGYSEEVETDDVDDVGKFLSDNLEAGLPALLIGPSSLGKTSRVNNYAKSHKDKTGIDTEIIHINLSSMDNVDVMGMPTKKKITSYISSATSEDDTFDLFNDDLGSLLDDVVTNSGTGLVDTLTIRTPDATIKDRFVNAIKDKKDVILFFDECNRVTNPSIMSAMFECISDHRIFGIDFSDYKEHVKIVAACNLGEDYTGAKQIDAALTARFCTYWKKGYDLKDTKSFLEFLKDKLDSKPPEIDGILYNFLKEMPETQLLAYLRSVEARTIDNATPSSRMMFQLSKDIKNMRGNKSANGEFKASVFNGTTLFDTISKNDLFSFYDSMSNPDVNVSVDKARGVIAYIKKNSTRWDAVLSGKTITFRNKEFTAEDTINYLSNLEDKLLKSMGGNDKNAVKEQLQLISGVFEAISTLDDKITNLRKDIFESYGGPQFAKDFTPYFNERFGTANDVEILIEMLDDLNLYPDFFKRKVADMAKLTPDLKITESINLIDQFSDYWINKGTLTPEHYAAFLSGIISGMPTTSNTMLLLKSLSAKQDPFMVKAEALGASFIKDVLSIYPKSINDAQIAQYQAGKNNSPKTTKKAKLI